MKTCLQPLEFAKGIFIVAFFTLCSFAIQSQTIPSPANVIGFTPGDDFKLANYDQSMEYFRKLEAVSDNIKIFQAGKTSEGRDWYFSVISSKANLDNLDRYKEIANRLAHPKGLSDSEAKALAREGKPLVHIDGGLHASEVAGAQHTITLAYELLSSDDPKIKDILDNVVVMLWPSLNPDGQNMIAEWYSSNVGTPYEIAPMPKLYQKYIGHDNNRDAYMLNMIESRVVARNWREWEPNIIHVHHQSSPFPTRIWLPPFAEPVASQTPPIVAREVNMIGMAMAQALESNGQEGAVHMGTGFDAWYPGYIDYMPMLQNIPAFWTETAGYRYATPKFYSINDFRGSRAELRNESLYSSPWKGGWWRIGDAVSYMQTASVAVLEYASKYSETVLYNRYQSGRNTIEKYTKEPPYAYFIPQEQRDPMRPVELLRRLAFNGIKISQLSEAITYNSISYPQGTWVIPMDQEFAELARQLLDVQNYPDLREYPSGPPEQPYDAAGWTLPLIFEVDVVPAKMPLTQTHRDAMQPVAVNTNNWEDETDAYPADFLPGAGFNTSANAAAIVGRSSSVNGNGSTAIVDPKENNSFRFINKALANNGKVGFSNGKYTVAGISRSNINSWASELSLNVRMANNVESTDIKPRIALYRPFTASMDEGWTRWLFERFGFEFTNIGNADFQMGNLNKRFDVIVFASERSSTFTNGFREGSIPPQYAGGMEDSGIRGLDEFVKAGGTLVTLNQSSNFAISALHLPVKDVTSGINRKDYFAGSSILEVETENTHPVMAGMPNKANIFVSRSPVFTALDGFEGQALAKYQTVGSPLRSGYLLGEKHIQGYAASLDVKHGNGHVILLGFAPQWRGQTMGTYRVLFNSIMYGGELARNQQMNTSFWVKPESK
jgi:Zinc carboxypeptidase